MVIGKNKKDILNLLLCRWKILSGYGALEIVQAAQQEFAKRMGINIPDTTGTLIIKPIGQIELIRQKIVEILPEAKFIDINYEAPAELQPQDFVELYISHQEICLQHIRDLMAKRDMG